MTKTYEMARPKIRDGFRRPKRIQRAADYYESISNGFAEYIGLREEKSKGVIPIDPLDSDRIGGLTESDSHGNSNIKINRKIADEGKDLDIYEVLWHELVHAQTASLNRYKDTSPQETTFIMEMLTEYALPKYLEKIGMHDLSEKINRDRKRRPLLYKRAYALGKMTDSFYRSELGNGEGIEAMMQDIQDTESMQYALRRWSDCKDRINFTNNYLGNHKELRN